MTFRPLNDRVLLQRVEEDTKTASGIIIPDTAQEKPSQGVVKATGPGVMHVAWGVDGIDAAFKSLESSGNTMRGDAPAISPFGYKTANIETDSSHGIHFQLAEGEPA